MRNMAIVLLAGVLVAPGGRARAASVSQEQEKILEFGTSTALVTVPVFVTDKSGAAVPGLTAADFEVESDGDRVRILEFQEIDAAAPPLPGEAGTATVAHARRQFLLLFDLSFSSVPGLVRVREAAQEFVRHMLLPSDLAGVATYSTRSGLRLLLSFTTDREQVAHAIEGLGLGETERPRDLLRLAFDSGALQAVTRGDSVSANDARFAEELRELQAVGRRSEDAVYTQKVEDLLRAMTGLGELLDVVQGRKQIVYFSSGFDQSILLGAQGAEALESRRAVTEGRLWEVDSERHFGSASARNRTVRLAEAFAASDAIVHTVDVSGLTAAASVEASSYEEQAATPRGRESLAQIAAQSGGRFIRDANDLTIGLGEILESTRHYYLLAFEPTGKTQPGEFHKVKVKVNVKDTRVSHRSGYRDRDPDQPRGAFAEQLADADALVKGIEAGGIPVDVLAVPYRGLSGRLSVPTVITVPGAGLSIPPSGAIGLDVVGYAMSAEGRVLDHVAARLKLDPKRWGAQLKGRGLQVHTAFALPPGTHSLRILVRENASQLRGLVVAQIVVPDLETTDLFVYPPVLMDDPAEWVLAPMGSQRIEHPELPFHVAGQIFVPLQYGQLAPGVQRQACIMSYGDAADDELAAWELGTQLVDAEGRPQPLAAFGLARQTIEADGMRRVVVWFKPGDLAPGQYALRVRLADRETGRQAEARSLFQGGP